MRQLSDILNELVPKKGKSASEVARKLNISSQLLGQYRNGGKNPSWEFLLKWLEVFGENLLEYFETKDSRTQTDEPNMTALLAQLMQKQNSLMEMQNKILTDQKESIVEKVKEIHSETKEIHLNSKSTIAYLQTILRVNRADDSVIMDNQDLQAGREIGSSAIQAGNLELAAAKHLRKKDRKNQGGVDK